MSAAEESGRPMYMEHDAQEREMNNQRRGRTRLMTTAGRGRGGFLCPPKDLRQLRRLTDEEGEEGENFYRQKLEDSQILRVHASSSSQFLLFATDLLAVVSYRCYFPPFFFGSRLFFHPKAVSRYCFPHV